MTCSACCACSASSTACSAWTAPSTGCSACKASSSACSASMSASWLFKWSNSQGSTPLPADRPGGLAYGQGVHVKSPSLVAHGSQIPPSCSGGLSKGLPLHAAKNLPPLTKQLQQDKHLSVQTWIWSMWSAAADLLWAVCCASCWGLQAHDLHLWQKRQWCLPTQCKLTYATCGESPGASCRCNAASSMNKTTQRKQGCVHDAEDQSCPTRTGRFWAKVQFCLLRCRDTD